MRFWGNLKWQVVFVVVLSVVVLTFYVLLSVKAIEVSRTNINCIVPLNNVLFNHNKPIYRQIVSFLSDQRFTDILERYCYYWKKCVLWYFVSHYRQWGVLSRFIGMKVINLFSVHCKNKNKLIFWRNNHQPH